MRDVVMFAGVQPRVITLAALLLDFLQNFGVPGVLFSIGLTLMIICGANAWTSWVPVNWDVTASRFCAKFC